VKKGALQGREKVLLAEDDSEIADLAGRVLQEAGYQVQVAPDGHRALDRVLRDGFLPDLLITDVIMPGMNGKELADRIQAACPKVRVLYSSGYSDNHLIRDGQLDPRIDFLQKPYSAVDLLRKIREILDR
jgi:CheY-like chemotaxis protein